MKTPEFVVCDEKRFIEFMSNLNEKDKIAIISHYDADGVVSAAIAMRVLGDVEELIITDYKQDLIKHYLPVFKKKKINKVFILDIALDFEKESIKELEKFAEILIIDHHLFKEDLNSPKTIFINSKSHFPAASLCHYLFSRFVKIDGWLAAIGITSDLPDRYMGENSIKVFDDYGLDGKEKIKNSSEIWERVPDVSYSLVHFEGNEGNVLDILMKAKNLDDLNKLHSYYEVIRKEIEKEIQKFKKNKEVKSFKQGDLIFYEINPKHNLKKMIITELSVAQRDKTFIFFKKSEDGKTIEISSRRIDRKIDLPGLLKESIKNIPNSRAGGHFVAAGGIIPSEHFSKFKENLIKNYSKVYLTL